MQNRIANFAVSPSDSFSEDSCSNSDDSQFSLREVVDNARKGKRRSRPRYTFPPRTYRRLEQIFYKRGMKMMKQERKNKRVKTQFVDVSQCPLISTIFATENRLVPIKCPVHQRKSNERERNELGKKRIEEREKKKDSNSVG